MMDSLHCGRFTLPTGGKTLVMGILNITPDSFSDGGNFYNSEAARKGFGQLIEQGADIIDIGAVSTRPGSEAVSTDEELRRIEGVLDLIAECPVPVSVDTTSPEVARKALEAGASIVNDISGGNGELIALAVEFGAAYVLTHNPCGADDEEVYPGGVVPAVRQFFIEGANRCSALGLPSDRLILDPGLGFGKSRADDRELLRSFEWLKFSGIALMCGVSRKRCIRGRETDTLLLDFATAAADTAAIQGGADIIRVHNVPAAKTAAYTADLLYR